MVDGADQWDTDAGADDRLRSARDRLVSALELHGRRLGVVMTADSAEARQRPTADGLVALGRRARRGFLLQPDWNDGDIVGITVPSKTIEPLVGIGRGLWCAGGAAVVAQLATGAPPDAAGVGG
jgi:S-DNA-T family DNA segregation ATPase FtsK/SpoIIIE